VARRRSSQPGPYLQHLEVIPKRIKDPSVYPFSLPAVRRLQKLVFHPKVTFLVGENGSGKSTLLEAVAIQCRLNPEGGSRNFNFNTRASHSILCDAIRLSMSSNQEADAYFLRAESYFNLATNIEELDEEPGAGNKIIDSYGGVSLHEQSHGESFFALFKNRFNEHGLYLLDEPEAALSPTRQLEFLALLHQYVLMGCQFVIATHSPIIMAYPDAVIHHFGKDGIQEVAYTDTEHYLITKRFLTHTRSTLEVLMSGADDGES
jgi:predicted ATPase